MTQAELGFQLHLTRQTISKWETGKSLPDLENLILLSRFYAVSLDELVGISTLDYSAENIKKANEKKEVVQLLTRNAKIAVGAVAAVFLLFYGGAVLQKLWIDHSPAYAGTFMIYGVKQIDYENNDPGPEESLGKIKKLTLNTGKTLTKVTYEQIKELGLTSRLKYPEPMIGGDPEITRDGFRISKNELN